MAVKMNGQRVIMSGVVLSNGDSEVVISEAGQTVRFQFALEDNSWTGAGEPEDIAILLPAGYEDGCIASGFGMARDHDRVMVNFRVDWVLPTMRQVTYTVYEEPLERW
ncbi:MAG TPA: hypothetical protein VF535_09875 [Allosphingosinicella sp.]|jgi:hypothetical protein